ncbi:hypothetical protein L3Q82_002464 [Scortum barcoo]|uniref:Uncharacterized protein n=1 Tax=Scortum barcoo TaxID=214431 RepID=A0ACB8VYU2_9TELE|nr:hypothetical protein L3Q82_002464 [Scortum barcoo]
MASAPSASALSAVLRCRGNIWSRSPPTKRPAAPVRGLGLPGGVRAAGGGRLTVAYTGGKARGEKDFRETDHLCHPRLSQSSGHARSAVRQLARALTCDLPGTDWCSHMVHAVRCQTYAARIRNTVCVQDARGLPAGAVKVSVKCPCAREASLALPVWSALKSGCLSVSALVSGFMSLRPGDAPQHQQDEGRTDDYLQKNIKDRYVARIGVTGAPPWSQAWGWGSHGWRLVAGSLPTGPGRAQPENGDVGPPSSRLTTRRKVHEGPVQCGLGSSRGGGLDDPIPGPKLWQ